MTNARTNDKGPFRSTRNFNLSHIYDCFPFSMILPKISAMMAISIFMNVICIFRIPNPACCVVLIHRYICISSSIYYLKEGLYLKKKAALFASHNFFFWVVTNCNYFFRMVESVYFWDSFF